MSGAIEFFDPERYLVQLSVRDNLVFGRILSHNARAAERIEQEIGALADELDFRRLVLEAGFDYTVGIGGSQLTPQQRQKLTLAAAVLRQVRILVAHAPTRDLHRGAATTVLSRVLATYRERTVVCALDDATLAPLFDRVLTLSHGQVIEDRAPEPADEAQPAPEAAEPRENAQPREDGVLPEDAEPPGDAGRPEDAEPTDAERERMPAAS